MADANEELLRQLGLQPGVREPGQPTTALTVEDWARGASPLRLRKSTTAPNDPRATTARDTASRGVRERALPSPVSEEQRQQAERGRAFQSKPPHSTEQMIEQAAIGQGVPAQIFHPPLTDFEVKLRTQEMVQLIHPERGLPTDRFLSADFTPLADPDTGATIGYAKSGADSLICDLQGDIVHWGDTPITPSAVQLDDLILIGGTLVKGGGKLLARGGAALVRSAVVRRVSNRVLMRLRTVAAAVKIGTSYAVPIVGGELGARAVITAEQRVVAGTLEEAASRATARTLSPIAGAIEVRLTKAQYEAALQNVFPSHYLNPITQIVDVIGRKAARRAVANPQFIQAIQQRNWTLAGTLFHSAAAVEARAVPVAALPPGWKLNAERTLQSGLGGSRVDILLLGPDGQVVEYDWKTRAISALSTSSRREMTRHAGHIATNVGGTLTVQESRTWIDFVRERRPDLFR